MDLKLFRGRHAPHAAPTPARLQPPRQRRVAAFVALFLTSLALPAAGAESHSSANPAAQDLKRFQLMPGLMIELAAQEPHLQNPVAFSIDGHGRFFVAETHRYRDAIFDITANTPWLLDDLSFRTVNDRAAFLARTFATNFAILTNSSELIRLVEDRNGDGTAETSSVFAEGFRESVSGTAAGVLAQGAHVWFTSIPDLWRLTIDDPRSTNRPPGSLTVSHRAAGARPTTSSDRTRLATGLGVHISVSGHDVHGLIRGPDGRIYFSFGDRGVCVTNREGIVLDVPDTGGVLRCEPDGRNLEIVCVGLRNPQELAFDDHGNLWTVDNDTGGADPCRVLHVVEGGDYGWRASYQHMKGFGPWVQEELWRGGLDGVLPPAGTVSQGPAGLTFHPGTSLAPQLNGKFLHADFPGGIWAYNVAARGASYALAGREKVLWNCWPTDVDFGPDGALYVLDWVQGWTPPGKGRIYRLTATADPAGRHLVAEVKRLLDEGMGGRGGNELLSLLAHPDRRVRLEAQWELAARGSNSLAGLIAVAQSGPNPLARIHALWGVRQIIRPLPSTAGAEELASLLPLLEDPDAEIRGQAALALGEGMLFNAEVPTGRLLRDPSPRTRFLAIKGCTVRWQGGVGSRLLAGDRVHFSTRQKIAGAVAERVAQLVGANPGKAASTVGATIAGEFPAAALNQILPGERDDPFVTHAAVDFLVNTRRNTAFESHYAINPSLESGLALLWANRRTGSPAVGDFLTNEHPRLRLEAARAINDAPIPAAYPALASMLEEPRLRETNWGTSALSNSTPNTPAGPFSANARPPREQVLRRALNAHFRLGDATNAQALARFAGEQSPNPARSTSKPKRAAPETPDTPDRPEMPDTRTGSAWPAALRAEALFLLGSWQILPARVGNLPAKPARDPNHGSVPTVNPENWPGWFDRVVGLWRPLPPRTHDNARAALSPGIAHLVSDPADEVALAAIDAAVKLGLSNAAPTLLQRMREPATSAAIRQRIPGALAALDLVRLRSALPLALADTSAIVRAAALPHLDRLEGNAALETLAPIVRRGILSPESPRSQPSPSPADLQVIQAALRALAAMKSPAVDVLLLELLAHFDAGRYPRTLELDLFEAAAGRGNAGIRSALERRAAESRDDGLAGWRMTLLGGDAGRGRTIFFEKVEVQCVRCHQVKKEGGIVGPALDGIGKRQGREYLLESIVHPNKVIAPGFESVLLTLTNGAEHAGIVKGENDRELRLESPEEGALTIVKADIAERRRSLSAMPEELSGFLSKRELRDLIEFLASLK